MEPPYRAIGGLIATVGNGNPRSSSELDHNAENQEHLLAKQKDVWE